MNIFQKFTRWLNEKMNPQRECNPKHIQFGSVNTETGEFFEGYIDKSGDMKYRPTGRAENVWSEPVYENIVTEWRVSRPLFGKETRYEWQRPMYKSTNRYTGKSRYFYTNIDGENVYLIAEAYERDGSIVRI